MSSPSNSTAHRAIVRGRARGHEQRERVCASCVRHGDFVFGAVHSEGPCGRCGAAPMGYGHVVGPNPWAGGTPFI